MMTSAPCFGVCPPDFLLPPREPDRSANPAFAEHALPDGTLLEGFRITRAIGEGGFGIVYLAWDPALERNVAIKEYMPSSLAVRAPGSLNASVRSERYRETFEAGLKSFVNEARLLAHFDHPALVKVHHFWEANRTAYMAMPYYEGPTLKAALAASPAPLTEAQLRAWLHPLLDALAVLHRERCYHRDVAPDNILLTATGPLLLDFGAARRVISDMTQALTAVLKPGYAPIEQYGSAMTQGPWTDLYALAGVVHYAITGCPPIPSVERVVHDKMQPLATTHAGRYRDGFLRAIDAALAVRAEARPQDVMQFVALLDAGLEPDGQVTLQPMGFRHSGAAHSDFSGLGSDKTRGQPTVRPARTGLGGLAHEETSTPRQGGRDLYVLVIAALLLAVGVVWWVLMRWGAPAPAVPPRPTTQETPAPARATRDAPDTPAAEPTPVAAPATAASVPSPAATPAETPAQIPATPAPPMTVESPAANDAPVIATPRRPVANPPVPPAERAKPPMANSRDVAESKRARQADRPSVSKPNEGARPPKCGAIVQKSSLESLSPEDVAFLKKECR